MLFSDDEFEEPVDVFYQRLSKLADYMLADPDLNMYLCVIQYPFVGGARLREAPDLIPKWCGYFPTEKQEMFMRVARRGDIGVFMFDKTAQYPNALYRTMSGLMWVRESIVVTNDPDFPTNVMNEMICLSQCVPAKSGVEEPFMLGSKSFVLSLDYDEAYSATGKIHLRQQEENQKENAI
ncbi:hypothetical protein [uncultured Corynebacterium sp.]|uniref:hypothetical protein n=1 Tax=uncultured Corynebacterium sp. TaxID=159447 RepID=UPI0028E78248|nr:hypothetical protein [uncultured Corynebacterium sp.]